MNFETLRNNIKRCNEGCKFKYKHCDTLYFDCLSPGKVRCLIITEQPKENIENIITEKSLKADLMDVDTNKTIGRLVDIFVKNFMIVLLIVGVHIIGLTIQNVRVEKEKLKEIALTNSLQTNYLYFQI